MIVPPAGFRTFNEFFTRKLHVEARPVDERERMIVSPVDGRIEQFGRIDSDMMIQSKGIRYSLYDLTVS
jgi:phosphatidylserine decarboxylase